MLLLQPPPPLLPLLSCARRSFIKATRQRHWAGRTPGDSNRTRAARLGANLMTQNHSVCIHLLVLVRLFVLLARCASCRSVGTSRLQRLNWRARKEVGQLNSRTFAWRGLWAAHWRVHLAKRTNDKRAIGRERGGEGQLKLCARLARLVSASWSKST